MFTIKSVSREGTYYLVKNWRKNKRLWVSETMMKKNKDFWFSSASRAKDSLETVLKVMWDDYGKDKFTVVDEDFKEIEKLTNKDIYARIKQYLDNEDDDGVDMDEDCKKLTISESEIPYIEYTKVARKIVTDIGEEGVTESKAKVSGYAVSIMPVFDKRENFYYGVFCPALSSKKATYYDGSTKDGFIEGFETWPDANDFLRYEFTDLYAEKKDKKERLTIHEDTDVSDDDVRELVLYITNESDLYNGLATSIMKNMARKMKAKKYDDELAVKGWMALADEGVRRYDREFGSGRGSLTMLNKKTREAIARELRDYYREETDEMAEKLMKKESLKSSIKYSDVDELIERIKKDIKNIIKRGRFEEDFGEIYVDLKLKERFFDDGSDGIYIEVRYEPQDNQDDEDMLIDLINKVIGRYDELAYVEPYYPGVLTGIIAL